MLKEGNIKEKNGVSGIYVFNNLLIESEEAKEIDNKLKEAHLLTPELYSSLIKRLKEICKVTRTSIIPNKVVASGREVIARLLFGDTTYSGQINYGALGSSNTAFNDTHTTLVTEVARKGIGTKNRSGDTVTFDFYFSKSDTSGTYEEFGCFIDGTSTANSGQLYNRILTGGWSKTASEAMTVSLQVNVKSSDTMDLDALAYIYTVETALGTGITTTQKNAINDFIVSEKLAGRWTSLTRFVLPIWNNASANAICLKTRTALTWVGSPIFGNGYVQGTGATSTYLRDTKDLAELGHTSSSMLLGAICIQAPTVTNDWLGTRNGVTDTLMTTSTSTMGASLGFTGLYNGSYGSAQQTGIFVASRTSSTATFLRRRRTAGVTDVNTNNSATSAGAPPSGTNAEMAYLVRWNQGINTPQFAGDGRFGAFFVGLGLDTTNVDAMTLNMKNLYETLTGTTLP